MISRSLYVRGQDAFCVLTAVCCLCFNLLTGMKSSACLDEGGNSQHIHRLPQECSRGMKYFKPIKYVFCLSRLGLLLATFHWSSSILLSLNTHFSWTWKLSSFHIFCPWQIIQAPDNWAFFWSNEYLNILCKYLLYIIWEQVSKQEYLHMLMPSIVYW